MTRASAAARQAVFAPLDGGDRVEAVIDRLTSALSLGLIADGEQLPGESELSASLGVATVTLREALSQMRSQGLIETRRGRNGGSFATVPRGLGETRLRKRLRSLGAHRLRDIGDLHIAVGGMAAMRAAQRADRQHMSHLHDLIAALDGASTGAERRRADGRFHIEIAAAAQSAQLTMVELSLQAEHGDLLWLHSVDGGQADVFRLDAVRDHHKILEAIGSGDAVAARLAMEEHIGDGVERLLDMHFRLNEDL